MEFIDDKDFLIVRKNLNIFSVIILVLAFTNAEVSILSLFGIQVKLNGEKLYVALFIGYAYFIWRYLTKLPLMSGFWNDFLHFYLDSKSGVKKQHTFARYRESFIENKPELEHILATDKNARLIDIKALRVFAPSIRRLRLSATFYATIKEGSQQPMGHNIIADHDIFVSRFLVMRKLLIFSLRYDKFGDYLFPLIPILINLSFFLLKREWQGGLFNLISDN